MRSCDGFSPRDEQSCNGDDAMRNALAPVLLAALDERIATHGTLAVAVGAGITPDTLRAARRGRVLNGGTVTAITAYVSASTHTASERRAA